MEKNALKALWTIAFGDDGWIDSYFRTAWDSRHAAGLSRQGQLAAALTWMDVSCQGRKLAYLYAIATHPDFRQQGLCRELMSRTHETLAEQGYAGTVLVPAGDDLRKMYAGMGYTNFGGMEEISVSAEKPVVLREITPEEYTRLRWEALPAGGIVQEAGAIAYLAETASLYAGADFLLAAVPEGDCLRGVELLGNVQRAVGIPGALGCGSGVFRIPGETPYAMFRPLTKDTWIPGYFGLAFE